MKLEDKIITETTYDFHQHGNNKNGTDVSYNTAKVGANGVVEIKELIPRNCLERHCCVINYEDGKALNVFNVNTISYSNNNI